MKKQGKFGKAQASSIGTKEVVCQPASQTNRGGRSPGWVSPPHPLQPLAKALGLTTQYHASVAIAAAAADVFGWKGGGFGG